MLDLTTRSDPNSKEQTNIGVLGLSGLLEVTKTDGFVVCYDSEFYGIFEG
jgi:hypothetical protein